MVSQIIKGKFTLLSERTICDTGETSFEFTQSKILGKGKMTFEEVEISLMLFQKDVWVRLCTVVLKKILERGKGKIIKASESRDLIFKNENSVLGRGKQINLSLSRKVQNALKRWHMIVLIRSVKKPYMLLVSGSLQKLALSQFESLFTQQELVDNLEKRQQSKTAANRWFMVGNIYMPLAFQNKCCLTSRNDQFCHPEKNIQVF